MVTFLTRDSVVRISPPDKQRGIKPDVGFPTEAAVVQLLQAEGPTSVERLTSLLGRPGVMQACSTLCLWDLVEEVPGDPHLLPNSIPRRSRRRRASS